MLAPAVNRGVFGDGSKPICYFLLIYQSFDVILGNNEMLIFKRMMNSIFHGDKIFPRFKPLKLLLGKKEKKRKIYVS